MKTRITINGKTYSTINDMPAAERRLYEQTMGMLADKDGNGVPDIMETGGSETVNIVNHDQKYVVNGQEYANLDDMPADVRKLLGDVMPSAWGFGSGRTNTVIDGKFTADQPKLTARLSTVSSRQPHSNQTRDVRLLLAGTIIGLTVALFFIFS